jgi:hypothetical protein
MSAVATAASPQSEAPAPDPDESVAQPPQLKPNHPAIRACETVLSELETPEGRLRYGLGVQ